MDSKKRPSVPQRKQILAGGSFVKSEPDAGEDDETYDMPDADMPDDDDMGTRAQSPGTHAKHAMLSNTHDTYDTYDTCAKYDTYAHAHGLCHGPCHGPCHDPCHSPCHSPCHYATCLIT